MTPQEWEHVCTLFEAVLAKAPADRATFIASLEGESSAVRQELMSLLAEHDDEATNLFAGDIARAAATLASELGEPVPEQIGPYTPTREVGRGGMGVVYLAHRNDGHFDQQVALKLVKTGMGDSEVQRRFLFERQVLARLQHPGIARLLDGGITEDGRPYFAMEYVDGQALFDYCNTNALDLQARLKLFLGVCEAVEYAHANLVVHRDLKPSNILVTSEGEARLLDFGIAKLLEEDSERAEDTAPLTRASMLLLTPEYGAPEQLSGGSITTATDVYALGVILYELVTGQAPYDLGKRTPMDVYEGILRTQPTRPSLAACEASAAKGWQRQLRGDLDVVIMTALAKEPARRYRSAGALGEDLRRSLEHRPITAHPDSGWYLASRFLRRHWLGAAAVSMVLFSLLAGLGTAAWQGQIAAREARRSESISSFLLQMLDSVNPDQAKGRDVTVREVLDQAALDLDDPANALAGDAAVQSALRATLGNTYKTLGQYERATEQLHKALGLSRESLGDAHGDTIRRLSDLGSAYFEWARIDDAEIYFREGQALARAKWGEMHELTQKIAHQAAGLHFRRGDYASAEQELEQIVAARRALLGDDHPDTLISQASLATSIMVQGRWEEALPALKDTWERQHRVAGPGNRATLVTRLNLASAYKMLDRYDDSQLHLEAVADLQAELLGPKHPSRVESMLRLAAMLTDAKRYERGERVFREALPLAEEVLGQDHWLTLVGHGNFGVLLGWTARPLEAEERWARSIEGLTAVLGGDHPNTLDMISVRDHVRQETGAMP